MTEVVGVHFRRAGRVYYFDPKDLELTRGSKVIVETARGQEYGEVVTERKEVEDEEVTLPLKPIIRMATPEDDERQDDNLEKEKEAFKICKKKIAAHGLEMNLISAEYTFDNKKLQFYFSAEGRVDFRDLVKDLASVFRTRIELRQIGVRDETKILGGIGICGRELCCASYLSDFTPVSIKMAKDQGLSLNPTKISGSCGRLMCCLKNEQDTYEYLNSKMPGIGDIVYTPDGARAEVTGVNTLREQVRVIIDTGEEREAFDYHVDELSRDAAHPGKKREKREKRDKKNRRFDDGNGGRRLDRFEKEEAPSEEDGDRRIGKALEKKERRQEDIEKKREKDAANEVKGRIKKKGRIRDKKQRHPKGGPRPKKNRGYYMEMTDDFDDYEDI